MYRDDVFAEFSPPDRVRVSFEVIDTDGVRILNTDQTALYTIKENHLNIIYCSRIYRFYFNNIQAIKNTQIDPNEIRYCIIYRN